MGFLWAFDRHRSIVTSDALLVKNMRALGVPQRIRFATVAAGLAATLAMTPAPAQSTAAARLRHLTGVDELKTWFNAGNGHPRLIFLLSPT